MRLFTEYLPYLSKGWAPSVRRLCLLLVAGAMLGAQPVRAEDFRHRRDRHPDAADQGQRGPCAAAPCRRQMPIATGGSSRLQDDGNWRGADRSISQLEDLRLLGHVLAHRYLHPTNTRPATSNLRDWLAKYGDLPEAPQIYALALGRQPSGAAAPPAPTVTKVKFYGNPDSSREPTFSTGAPAWKPGAVARWQTAAGHFENVATRKGGDDWSRAAGAFWAARSHLKAHQPEEVTKWLKEGGQLSPHLLRPAVAPRPGHGYRACMGRGAGAEDRARQILETRAGARALALIQIGENDLAEKEMHQLLQGKGGKELGPAILAVAQAANLPSLCLRLGVQYREPLGPALDPAIYPLPDLGAAERLPDRSRAAVRADAAGVGAFNPEAKSAAGASGLMQLMPATAAAMDEVGDLLGKKKRALLDPESNLTLAQRYVRELLGLKTIKGDLLQFLVAYNAGPGQSAEVARPDRRRPGPAAVHREHPRARDAPLCRARAHLLLDLPGAPGPADHLAGRAGLGRLADLYSAAESHDGGQQCHVLTKPGPSCRSTSRS